MTVDAIQLTTEALRGLLEARVDGGVFAGPPSDSVANSAGASVFLYHCVPNADLRNEPNLGNLRSRGAPGTGAPVDGRNDTDRSTIPFDLRYLITVSRPGGGSPGSSPIELLALGQVIQALHDTPVLTGARLPGQTVRLSPDPVSMEEISRVWGLFPETPYRTSIVYLATPVFVDAGEFVPGPRVREVQRETARLESAPT